MSSAPLNQQIDVMRRRVSVLYQSAQTISEQELLPRAFEELQLAIEELQSAEENLAEHHQELQAHIDQIEQERQRYQELFENAPVGYLITSLDGSIRQANQAAQQILGTTEKFLVGRSLALFVPSGGRRAFRERVSALRQTPSAQDWQVELQPWEGSPAPFELTVALIQGSLGRATGLRWLVRPAPQTADAAPSNPDETTRLRARVALLEQQLAEQRQQFEALATRMALLTQDMRTALLDSLTQERPLLEQEN
ncbi:MAG TPA: PAS domain S-box protein [Roseiflexaceae bacterium]|nr:PAS domain S-box protein [Roseiflexaceae bacterium]